MFTPDEVLAFVEMNLPFSKDFEKFYFVKSKYNNFNIDNGCNVGMSLVDLKKK